jgi:hypothetical protein
LTKETNMSKFTRLLTLGVVLSVAIGGAVLAQAPAAEPPQRGLVVADYTVFLDPPTGFVFVKLPQGWKFVGAVERVDLGRLPGNVVTTLLTTGSRTADAE